METAGACAILSKFIKADLFKEDLLNIKELKGVNFISLSSQGIERDVFELTSRDKEILDKIFLRYPHWLEYECYEYIESTYGKLMPFKEIYYRPKDKW